MKGKQWLLTCACLALFVKPALAQEKLQLDIISYDQLAANDEEAISSLVKALYEKGVVAVENVPGYKEKLEEFLVANRTFNALPEEVKEKCAPNFEEGDLFVGYERGKEKFQRDDGEWFIDDLKVSYYAFVPDRPENKWPEAFDLKTAFQGLGNIMSEAGLMVLNKLELTGEKAGIDLSQTHRTARMLFYQKSEDTFENNPYWCGAHFDHSVFTALTPATYFVDGTKVDEPEEAGLFVRVDDQFYKVDSNPDLLLFQVGEFGQLIANDSVRATEHRVHKAKSAHVDRYAMALFFDAPLDTVIHSTSCLTEDSRYSGSCGDPCSYQHWQEESFKRYIVEEEA